MLVLAPLLLLRRAKSAAGTRTHVLVVVVGDIGRSPRMMNHAML
jgi:hypothetical protein